MVMIVLLKEACTVAIACGTFFFSFLAVRTRLPLPFWGFSGVADAAVASAISLLVRFGYQLSAVRALQRNAWLGAESWQLKAHFFVAFFLPAMVCLRGPLRVRAFVWVLWPRTGRLRR